MRPRPLRWPATEGWLAASSAGLLKLTSGTRDVVTSAIVVVGPFISSAFSLFLPTGAG